MRAVVFVVLLSVILSGPVSEAVRTGIPEMIAGWFVRADMARKQAQFESWLEEQVRQGRLRRTVDGAHTVYSNPSAR